MFPIAQRHGIQLGGQTDFTGQPVDNPAVGNPRPPVRKLAFFRAVGAGEPMWSGSCIYGLSGASPSFSQYDAVDTLSAQMDEEMEYQVSGGTVTQRDRVAVMEPTMTRQPRVSAHYDSSPAARSFQSFASVRWSGLMDGFRPQIMPRPLVQSFNPNQAGSKELHPPTRYRPYPPMGSIVPAYGEGKAL